MPSGLICARFLFATLCSVVSKAETMGASSVYFFCFLLEDRCLVSADLVFSIKIKMDKKSGSGDAIAQYNATYSEEQCIGRGNFGAAMLVTHKKEGKKYIAKRVNLEAMPDKEQEGCMMEVNLLKNLDHCHIVAYKESFLTANLLVIVMEYCEGKFVCKFANTD